MPLADIPWFTTDEAANGGGLHLSGRVVVPFASSSAKQRQICSRFVFRPAFDNAQGFVGGRTYARPNEACAALWYLLHHLGDVLADLAQTRGIVGRQVKRLKELQLGERSMKPITTFIIGALVVAVAVLGYFYYQRTKNDVTIQLPKVELKR